jgi:hypothetical protein
MRPPGSTVRARRFLIALRFAVSLVTILVSSLDPPMAAAADISHEMGKIKAKSLLEISGIAASRQNSNVLWMHNDGDTKFVYAVATTGAVICQVATDSPADDVEDIAIGPGPEKGVDYIYLGDIGDNGSKRPNVRVIRFAEPALKARQDQPGQAMGQSFSFTYPDGPHDAEALMVDPITGDVVIATKSKKETRVYLATAKAPKNDFANLVLIATLEVDDVSAGDISHDGSLIALRKEETGWLWERRSGESLRTALARKPRKIPVLGKNQAKNGEAIAFAADGRGYFTISEGRQGKIYLFDLPAEKSDKRAKKT